MLLWRGLEEETPAQEVHMNGYLTNVRNVMYVKAFGGGNTIHKQTYAATSTVLLVLMC
jgi:hypothetical protein